MGKKLISKPNGLIHVGDKRLTQVCETVEDFEDIEVTAAINTMKDFLGMHPRSQGISAPQIGSRIRVFIGQRRKKRIVMINPVIERTIGKKTSLEGCESDVGNYYMIKRPIFSRVLYVDEAGIERIKWFGRKWSRIIAHEVDHLDGIILAKGGVRWRGSNYAMQYSLRQNEKASKRKAL